MHIDCTIGDPSFYEGQEDRGVFVRWVGDDICDKKDSRKERIMYEPSRQVLTFTIAGFSHWYGYQVFDKLKIGTELTLVPEFDNPYDSNAVAIWYEDTKLGFVPAKFNAEIAPFLYFGHANLFECLVTQVDPDTHPENQVRVTVNLVDAR